MENFLMDTVIDKINGQENRIEQNENRLLEIESKVAEVSNQESNITNLTCVIEELQNKMSHSFLSKEQIAELSFRIKLNNDLLANPVKSRQMLQKNLSG